MVLQEYGGQQDNPPRKSKARCTRCSFLESIRTFNKTMDVIIQLEVCEDSVIGINKQGVSLSTGLV